MKKLISLGCKSIILTLFFFSFCHAQIIKDVSVYRGDSTRIEFKTNGNITTKGIIFVVKLTKSFSSPRLIQKKNIIAGGSAAEIVANYSAPQTKITVILGPEDTQDLTGTIYYYDIIATDGSTLTSYQTFNYGNFKIIQDVQTPFDGTNLPEDGTRVTTVSLENGTIQNELIYWDTTLAAWLPSGVTISSGGSVSNADSLGGVPASGYLENGDSTQFRTFSDFKYAAKVITDSLAEDIANTVTLNTPQTITGLKTFGNNKTVFSGDSVGIKGKLDIDKGISIGSGTNTLTFDPLTLLQDGSLSSFILNLNEPSISANQYGIEINVSGFSLFRIASMYAPSSNPGIVSLNGSNVNASDGNWVSTTPYSLYTMNGLRTDGDIVGGEYSKIFLTDTVYAKTVTVNSNYTFPITDGMAGQLQKTDGNGNLYWASDATGSGGAAYTDSVTHDGRKVPGDSLMTDAEGSERFTPLSFLSSDEYYFLTSDWLNYDSPGLLRLGKSYADRRFNNGTYSDVWMIDYVVPPYNLSSSWLFPIEHRIDYYNDTLQTISSVANIFNIDTTGSGIWRTTDVNISGVETEVNVGDLPDSTTLVWANTGLYGNKITLKEANLTPTAKRFPMKVKGYSFDIGTNAYYTYPELYSYYSNLGSGNLEKAYHFYGEGNYPSYFGGNILTDGYIRVQDSIIIGSSTVKIYPDSITIGGVRVAKVTESGNLDTTIVNNLIEANEDSSGSNIIGTTATLDSIITDYWNDNLGGTTFDSTFVYQRITTLESNVAALEDSITYIMNTLTSILAALDTCGCSAVITDNTAPLKPTSFVAVGGTSETQYVSTWADPTASDLDSIRFYEGSTNDSTALTYVASIPAGTQTYTRTGRTANTTYWAAVKAIDDSGNVSYFSNIDSAKTKATSGVTPFATLDFEEGNLSEWTSTSGANLSASTTFAHTGTYSMRAGTNSFGVYDYTATDTVWATFWVYLPSTSSQSATTNYIAMFNNTIADRTNFGTNQNGGTTWEEWIVGVSSGDITDGDFTTNFSQNAWHKVKIKYETNGTTTSYHQVWVDGTSIWSATAAYVNTVSNFTAGSESATITGYFYIDDINLYLTDPDL